MTRALVAWDCMGARPRGKGLRKAWPAGVLRFAEVDLRRAGHGGVGCVECAEEKEMVAWRGALTEEAAKGRWCAV